MFKYEDYHKQKFKVSGIGLVNLAAFGYYKNEDAPKIGLSLALPYPTSPPTGMPVPGQPSCNMPYPSAAPPYPSAASAYPTMGSMPYPGAPYPSASATPYPSSSATPYPSGGFPAMPQPYGAGGAPSLYPKLDLTSSTPYPSIPSMPLPYAPPPSVPNLYPQLPQLPDPVMPTAYAGSAPPPDVPTKEEEPSVGMPEIVFSCLKVPETENAFWLGDSQRSSRNNPDIQNFDMLRNSCLESGSLFDDPQFPANNDSLMFSRRPDRHIEWLRPHEICDDPQFFVEGYSRFDVQQGELGDCWLLAATANLTQDANLFFRVIPDDQGFEENYSGIFHFRFWQYGNWIDVVIDDRLPTSHGELLYMHSTEKNEFWSALLEKAYAKLHGSYEALKGGTTCEAMEDFTGGVTEWYDMKEAPPNLFNILQKAAERNSMMGCSLEPDPNEVEAETREGLIRGHAYSITKVCMIDIVTPNRNGKIPMIRMRNPWGNEAEWNGPWSDSSPEWRYIPEDEKHRIGLNFDRDGEFWMSFQDFLNHFDRVEICNLSPDSLSDDQRHDGKRKWEMSMFEGEWTPGVTAGGCRNFIETFWHNPQYVISLTDPDEEDDDGKCTVIVALMQKNRRSKRNLGMECLTVGFAIYHLTDRDLETRPQGLNFFKYRASVARSPHFINTREVCARFKLPPGHYLIVPSTFDPNEEGEFIIRVFSESKNNMEENDDQVGYGQADDHVIEPARREMDPQRENLYRLFQSIAGADMEVDWMELKRILDHSLRDDDLKMPFASGKPTDYATAGGGGGYDGGGGGGGYGGGGYGGGGGGGGAQTAGDSNGLLSILATICGPFCKGTPFEDMLNANEQQDTTPLNQTNATNGNIVVPPVMMDNEGGFSKDVCRSMVAMMDKDQSGKLGFEEFEALLTDIAKWKAVFKSYDHDRTGQIDGFQLREALKSAGYHLNNHTLNALAHRYSSRDGKITFDDFLMCAIKIKTFIDIFKEKNDASETATFNMEEWMQRTMYV